MKRVVTIGGGSGSYTILTGLKEFPLDITAIVTAFDSGGSSGALRDQFGILPPGDVRRCLVALSEGSRAQILRDLFNFRFDNAGTDLHNHSFGNLLLLALSSIYGGDVEAIKKASELLTIKGAVLPVSVDRSHIHAILEDGSEIIGETNIDIPQHDGNLRIDKVFLKPEARIYLETAEAIRNADLIVIAPGDLYTSVIPNFLVSGMQECLRESKAKKIAVCSLMTKWGETNNFDSVDFVKELLRYSGLEKFDYIICNTESMDSKLVAAYAQEYKHPLLYCEDLALYAKRVITGILFSHADIARHDSHKIAQIISEL